MGGVVPTLQAGQLKAGLHPAPQGRKEERTMLTKTNRDVIERLLSLNEELALMQNKKGYIKVSRSLLMVDIFCAVFGEKKAEELCQAYLKEID